MMVERKYHISAPLKRILCRPPAPAATRACITQYGKMGVIVIMIPRNALVTITNFLPHFLKRLRNVAIIGLLPRMTMSAWRIRHPHIHKPILSPRMWRKRAFLHRQPRLQIPRLLLIFPILLSSSSRVLQPKLTMKRVMGVMDQLPFHPWPLFPRVLLIPRILLRTQLLHFPASLRMHLVPPRMWIQVILHSLQQWILVPQKIPLAKRVPSLSVMPTLKNVDAHT
mmetsp:Transcript_35313/g.61973  ORF Transcript_35313/g.61973 Transcript_35313/m.61973 type:complete len:225 (+) Transcript_35313:261-935(+)